MDHPLMTPECKSVTEQNRERSGAQRPGRVECHKPIGKAERGAIATWSRGMPQTHWESRTGSDSDLVAWNATPCFCRPNRYVTFNATRSLSLPVLLYPSQGEEKMMRARRSLAGGGSHILRRQVDDFPALLQRGSNRKRARSRRVPTYPNPPDMPEQFLAVRSCASRVFSALPEIDLQPTSRYKKTSVDK